MNDDYIGTIVIKATKESLDMYVQQGITKEQALQILYEALVSLDEMPINADDPLPDGPLGAMLQ